MTMINTESIPEFIRWALDEAKFQYVLTNRLNTDSVETLHAELRQAGGDRRNVSVADVMNAIPTLALAKQSLKSVSIRGANVNPSVAEDTELSTTAGYARQLSQAPKLPSRARPGPSAPAFKAQYFFGRVCRILTCKTEFSEQYLEAEITRAKDLKAFDKSKAIYKAEFAFDCLGEMKVYQLNDKKNKEAKVLQMTLGDDGDASIKIISPAAPIGPPRVFILHCVQTMACVEPFVYVFIKLQPIQIEGFKLALSQVISPT